MLTDAGRGGEPMRFSGVAVFGTSASGDPVPLLQGIEFTVHPGEWVNVVGVNGSGKSTLARLTAGLFQEGLTGEIDRGFAGDAVSPIVLQRPEGQLFGETPREEIEFALQWKAVPRERMDAQVEEILSATGLQPHADFRWDALSGGQRQLAAVAAASAAGAPLVVFDEATSMLDDRSREAVAGIARSLHARGTAVIWVTQRLDELRAADRTVAVADGRIAYDGDGRTFFYGSASGTEERKGVRTPCETCGLRLPYLAAMALRLRETGRLQGSLPLTEDEWREVWGDGKRIAE